MSNHNMNFHGDNKNINAFLLKKKVPYLDQQKYQYFLAAKSTLSGVMGEFGTVNFSSQNDSRIHQ